jgi:phage terminase large subunit
MATAPAVIIPYAPRRFQQSIHDALDVYRWAVAVCHRRFGKTVLAVNQLQKSAKNCRKPRPRYAYIAPTFTMGKSICWDYLKHFSRPFPDVEVNESELRIDYRDTDAQIRIYGADNPDRMRGLYFDGVVLDEYGLMPANTFSEVVRATLADREGWALFIGTPNGKNQFYDVVQQARMDPSWFLAEYRASQTGILPRTELENAKASMTEDEYLQEYECSFEASVKGAVFARELMAARADGRVTVVPYDPLLKVDTDWDLGVNDQTAIWFSQSSPGGQVRLIDYYEASGFGLDHYAGVLRDKPYVYGNHWPPHDIAVRELGSGNSRLQAAWSMGLNFQAPPEGGAPSLKDTIHAVRMMFPRCWFDERKCAKGIETLQHYRWDFNARIDDFTGHPVHDWASHGADAFRGLGFRHYIPKHQPEREARAEQRRAQKDDEPFRWQSRKQATRGGY